MKCKEIMTKDPVCCLPGDTVDQAAQLMSDEDVGPIPVVADQKTKRLIGIVTDRDLAVKVVAPARHVQSVTVEEVMSRDPVTCHADDDLQKAVDAMEKHQVRRIPVVDDNTQIIGIIAQADIATRAGERETTAEVVEEISKSAITSQLSHSLRQGQRCEDHRLSQSLLLVDKFATCNQRLFDN